MKILVTFTILVGFASVSCAQVADKAATPATSPDELNEQVFDQARKLFFQGQAAKSIDLLKGLVQKAPDKTSYRLMLAKAYLSTGKKPEAAEQLRAVLKLNPDHAEAGVELAEMLAGERNWDEVIKLLEPMLKFKHDYPLYHLLAVAYYEKENMPQAAKHFEEAVKLNPGSGDDYYRLANIYLAQTHFAKAADAYEKAQALGIDSAVLHFKLASVYFNLRNYLGRVTQAEVLGGSAGQIKDNLYLIDPAPGRKDTFYAAAPKSAIFQVARARQMGIDAPQIRFLEANIWLNANRYAKADAIYKQLEGKLDKADQGLFWYYWAQAALGMDRYDDYLAKLGKAVEVEPATYKPTLADAYLTVARRYQQRGDDKLYIENLTRAVEVNPLSAGLHLTFGDALWQLNRRDEAVAQYKLVLDLEPDHAERIRLLNRIREQPATTRKED